MNILQTRRRLIHQIFGFAGAIEPPRDFNFAVGSIGGGSLTIGVVEGQTDLGHADRRTVLRPREDHIIHALAAKLASGLFAHHPLDRVDDIRFATTVRTDDAGHAVVEAEDRAVYKRFKTMELQAFDAQWTLDRSAATDIRGLDPLRTGELTSPARAMSPETCAALQNRP